MTDVEPGVFLVRSEDEREGGGRAGVREHERKWLKIEKSRQGQLGRKPVTTHQQSANYPSLSGTQDCEVSLCCTISG